MRDRLRADNSRRESSKRHGEPVSRRWFTIGAAAVTASLLRPLKANAQLLTTEEIEKTRGKVNLLDFVKREVDTNADRKNFIRQVIDHLREKAGEAPVISNVGQKIPLGKYFSLYNGQAIATVRDLGTVDKLEIVRQIGPRVIATAELSDAGTEREVMACHIRVLRPNISDNFITDEVQKLIKKYGANIPGREVQNIFSRLASQPLAIDTACFAKTGELASGGITIPMTLVPSELRNLGVDYPQPNGEIEIVLKHSIEPRTPPRFGDREKAEQLARRLFEGVIFHFLPHA